MTDPHFSEGDRVRVRVEPTKVGRIDGPPVPYSGGWTYPVFFGAETSYFAESGLERVPDEAVSVVPRDEFLRALLLAKLDNPLSDILYAYQASRTQYEPYQFKPVFKYLDAPVPGLLIADEVGLGKTIEAAILHQELKARARVNRVLVVCPAGLRVKWQSELLTRFDEQFQIMRSADLFEDIRLYQDTDGAQPLQGITGLETIRGRAVQEALSESPVRYDLVIVDEAHHLRTSGTLSNQIGERLSDLTDNLVLLTATPLQTKQEDLFNLLQFIDDTQFQQFSDFELQLQPNAKLNSAIRSLRELPPDVLTARNELLDVRRLPAAAQVTNHPNYQIVLDGLSNGSPDRPVTIRLQRDIDQMNAISSVYTRTRKRDVTGVAKREAHVLAVEITEQERAFYAAVLAHARAEAMRRSKNGAIPGFIGMMRERQAASSITATREYLTELLKGSEHLQLEDSSSDVPAEDDRVRTQAGDDGVAALLAAAQALGSTDSKFAKFAEALRQALDVSQGSKVIVFSFFRRTLTYLERELKRLGFDVLQINGSIPPDERALAMDRFRTNPDMQVLLTSEVGAEGLDFQFCDTLFNYDLPWNPMRVEQRIGRIDRYGQKADKIRIYSFFLSDTIEERILERLYKRIGIFEDSIGDLEPILGPLSNQLSREVFSTALTPAEEIELAQRYADLVINRREDERALESRSAELMGQDALILEAVNETVSSGRYISPSELRSVVDGYLRETSVNAELEDQLGDGTVLLRPDHRLAEAVEAFVSEARDHRPTTTEFLAKLHRQARIPATFDGQIAMISRRLELLNRRHPLVQTAVAYFQGRPRPARPLADLVVQSSAVDAAVGHYTFAIFLLKVQGAQPQTRLVSIALDDRGSRSEAVEAALLRLIQDDSVDGTDSGWTAARRDRIASETTRAVADEAAAIERDAIQRNDGVLAVRTATLQRTFRSKIAKRRSQIASTSDERIHRMWTSEIRNLETELIRRLEELEQRRAVGVSFAPIGTGRITIRPADEYPIEVVRPPEPEPPPGPIRIGRWEEPPLPPRRDRS